MGSPAVMLPMPVPLPHQVAREHGRAFPGPGGRSTRAGYNEGDTLIEKMIRGALGC